MPISASLMNPARGRFCDRSPQLPELTTRIVRFRGVSLRRPFCRFASFGARPYKDRRGARDLASQILMARDREGMWAFQRNAPADWDAGGRAARTKLPLLAMGGPRGVGRATHRVAPYKDRRGARDLASQNLMARDREGMWAFQRNAPTDWDAGGRAARTTLPLMAMGGPRGGWAGDSQSRPYKDRRGARELASRLDGGLRGGGVEQGCRLEPRQAQLRFRRGSRASRMPSPSRLKPSTVIIIAMPGKKTKCGEVKR